MSSMRSSRFSTVAFHPCSCLISESLHTIKGKRVQVQGMRCIYWIMIIQKQARLDHPAWQACTACTHAVQTRRG
jgi:hypothetical protein